MRPGMRTTSTLVEIAVDHADEADVDAEPRDRDGRGRSRAAAATSMRSVATTRSSGPGCRGSA